MMGSHDSMLFILQEAHGGKQIMHDCLPYVDAFFSAVYPRNAAFQEFTLAFSQLFVARVDWSLASSVEKCRVWTSGKLGK